MPPGIRKPETDKIELPRGDWILVKKYLTAGEMRANFARLMVPDGSRVDPLRVGVAKVVTYLLDWSITDADDKPLVIRDQPDDVLLATLDLLDADCYEEVKDAVDAHEAAMQRAREAEKKRIRDGGMTSSSTSPSPNASAGAMSGSVTSTPTSTG